MYNASVVEEKGQHQMKRFDAFREVKNDDASTHVTSVRFWSETMNPPFVSGHNFVRDFGYSPFHDDPKCES